MNIPEIKKECVKPLLDTKYIKVADLQYAEGCHYFNATRRDFDNLIATKPDDEFRSLVADAVTIAVILKGAGQQGSVSAVEAEVPAAGLASAEVPAAEPRLLLSYEYRYPAGRFLLSPPAGLIDRSDIEAAAVSRPSGSSAARTAETAVLQAAKREIFEETGLKPGPSDKLFLVNPLLFSTPGMTDECNAIACAVLNNPDLSALSQAGAEGTECFDGFELVTKAQALELINRGTDKNGIFYSAYTWIVLMYFISGLWDVE